MVDCPCGYGKNISEEQKNCHVCGTDLTPLHRLKAIPKLYYNEGIRLFERGNLDAAVEKLMTAISLEPNSADAYIALGNIYLQKGLYAEVLTYIKKALEIIPENENAIACMKKADELIETKAKKERTRKQFTFAGFGITFIVGMLVLFFLQGIVSKSPPPIKIPIEKNEQKEAVMTYTVRKGDTLSSIAKRKYGSVLFWQKIYEVNKEKLINADRLSVGVEILLPEILIKPK